jgi:hypothetical protein
MGLGSELAEAKLKAPQSKVASIARAGSSNRVEVANFMVRRFLMAK